MSSYTLQEMVVLHNIIVEYLGLCHVTRLCAVDAVAPPTRAISPVSVGGLTVAEQFACHCQGSSEWWAGAGGSDSVQCS